MESTAIVAFGSLSGMTSGKIERKVDVDINVRRGFDLEGVSCQETSKLPIGGNREPQLRYWVVGKPSVLFSLSQLHIFLSTTEICGPECVRGMPVVYPKNRSPSRNLETGVTP